MTHTRSHLQQLLPSFFLSLSFFSCIFFTRTKMKVSTQVLHSWVGHSSKGVTEAHDAQLMMKNESNERSPLSSLSKHFSSSFLSTVEGDNRMLSNVSVESNLNNFKDHHPLLARWLHHQRRFNRHRSCAMCSLHPAMSKQAWLTDICVNSVHLQSPCRARQRFHCVREAGVFNYRIKKCRHRKSFRHNYSSTRNGDTFYSSTTTVSSSSVFSSPSRHSFPGETINLPTEVADDTDQIAINLMIHMHETSAALHDTTTHGNYNGDDEISVSTENGLMRQDITSPAVSFTVTGDSISSIADVATFSTASTSTLPSLPGNVSRKRENNRMT